jgi:GNAT superfamily N-acetyltransferase
VGRRLTPLDTASVGRLPEPCRHCAFWELGMRAPRRGSDEAGQLKAGWVARVVREWGPAGHLISVDGVLAGYSLYAPAEFLDQIGSQAARPVSRDAILLATVSVEPDFTGQGLGKVLLQAMARDLTKRKVKAAEAFADRAWDGRACHMPAGFLEASGFSVVREHPRFPLMRMDLRKALSLKDVGEAALERLRVPVPQAPSLRPVPAEFRNADFRNDEAPGRV